MPQTRNQQYAQRAYERVAPRRNAEEYRRFAKSFPALIQSCGLCQAVAFAAASQRTDLLDDLAVIISGDSNQNGTSLARDARTKPVTDYLRLSGNALQAAVWIKRHVEALEETVVEETN